MYTILLVNHPDKPNPCEIAALLGFHNMSSVTTRLRAWQRVALCLQQSLDQWFPLKPQEIQTWRFAGTNCAGLVGLAMDEFDCLYTLNPTSQTVLQLKCGSRMWQHMLRTTTTPTCLAVVPASGGKHRGKLVVGESSGHVFMMQVDCSSIRHLVNNPWQSTTCGVGVSFQGMLVHIDGIANLCYMQGLDTGTVARSWRLWFSSQQHNFVTTIMFRQDQVFIVWHHTCKLVIYLMPEDPTLVTLCVSRSLHCPPGSSVKGCALLPRGDLVLLFGNSSPLAGSLEVYGSNGTHVGHHALAYEPLGCTVSKEGHLVVLGSDCCVHTYRGQ